MPELVKRPRYKVGDLLQLKWRGPRWVGAVTEARGTYSLTGHVLYNVRVPLEPEPLFLLLHEEEVDDPLILAKFAEEVHRLLDTPTTREVFTSQCREYLREREDDADRPPPMDLLRNGTSLTLAEKYALLAALHTVLCAGQDQIDPATKPKDLTWDEFFKRNFEAYKDAVKWAALVEQVKDGLAPQNADDIKGWLDDVKADLQGQQQGANGQG